MVEGYGVKVDQALHAEVLDRNAQFKSAPYSGFVNPVLVPSANAEGEIIEVEIVQPASFEEQIRCWSVATAAAECHCE